MKKTGKKSWHKFVKKNIEKKLKKSWEKVGEKLEKSWKKVEKKLKNIARGTTDPGYWVYNMNHFSGWYELEILLAQRDYSSYGLNTLGPLCLWQCFSTCFQHCFFSTFSQKQSDLFQKSYQMASLALVPILGTRWRYFNWLPMWKLVANMATRWHYLH